MDVRFTCWDPLLYIKLNTYIRQKTVILTTRALTAQTAAITVVTLNLKSS